MADLEFQNFINIEQNCKVGSPKQGYVLYKENIENEKVAEFEHPRSLPHQSLNQI